MLSIPPGHCLHETSDESPKPSETPFPHLSNGVKISQASYLDHKK